MQSKSKSKGKKLTGFKQYPKLSLGWEIKEVNPSRSKSKQPVIKLNSVQSSKRFAPTKTEPQPEPQLSVHLDYFPTQSNIQPKPSSKIKSEVRTPCTNSRINPLNDPVEIYGLTQRQPMRPKDTAKGLIYPTGQPSIRSSSRSSSRPKDNIQSLGDGYNYFKDDKNAKTIRWIKKFEGTQKITEGFVRSPKN